MASRRSQYNTQDNLQVVRIDQLVLLDQMQVREKLDPQLVDDYRRLFVEVGEEKCTCPPITVYLHQGSYVVADGHHRVTAAKRAGRTTLRAYIREGALDDGVVYAVNHNLRHGLQYNRADRQKIVLWFLDHPRYGSLSNRDIAALMDNRIPHTTVGNIRNRRKMASLEEVDKLSIRSAGRPAPEQQARMLQRAYDRMQDSAVFMLGMAQERPEATALLTPLVQAARLALARLKEGLELLEGDDEPDDA